MTTILLRIFNECNAAQSRLFPKHTHQGWRNMWRSYVRGQILVLLSPNTIQSYKMICFIKVET